MPNNDPSWAVKNPWEWDLDNISQFAVDTFGGVSDGIRNIAEDINSPRGKIYTFIKSFDSKIPNVPKIIGGNFGVATTTASIIIGGGGTSAIIDNSMKSIIAVRGTTALTPIVVHGLEATIQRAIINNLIRVVGVGALGSAGIFVLPTWAIIGVSVAVGLAVSAAYDQYMYRTGIQFSSATDIPLLEKKIADFVEAFQHSTKNFDWNAHADNLEDAIYEFLRAPLNSLGYDINNNIIGEGDAARYIAHNLAHLIGIPLTPFWYISDVFFERTLITPLVIDLDGTGLKLSDMKTSHAYFDLDGDGFAERTGWIQNGSGLLVIDSNNNGKIDNINELFGGEKAFAKLALYDINKDGVIDKDESKTTGIMIWVDRNHDGIGTSDEYLEFEEAGIDRISVNATEINENIAGNQIVAKSDAYFTSGGITKLYDVKFSTSRYDTHFIDNLDHSSSQDIPALRGWGSVKALRSATADDAVLMSLVKYLSNNYYTMSPNDFDRQFEDMLFKWSSSYYIEPASRGSYIDARKLGVVESFYGEKYIALDKFGVPVPDQINLSSNAAHEVELMYQKIFMHTKVSFISDIARASLYDETSSSIHDEKLANIIISIGYDPDSDIMTGDFMSALRIAENYEGSSENHTLRRVHDISNLLYQLVARQGNTFDDYAIDFDYLRNMDRNSILRYMMQKTKDDYEKGYIVHKESLDGIYKGSPGREGISEFNDSDPKDSYYFFKGDGSVSIFDGELNNRGVEDDILTVVGYSQKDISLVIEYRDLIISFSDNSDIILLKDEFIQDRIGIEKFRFIDGDLSLADLIKFYINRSGTDGNDEISGSKFDDIIVGRKGDDVINGSFGNDSYIYNKGDGYDEINSLRGFVASGKSILYLNGILKEDVRFGTNGIYLQIKILENDVLEGGIRIRSNVDYFNDPIIKEIKFEDGYSIDIDEAYALARAAQITDGNDEITGTSGPDVMRGGKGDDHLTGRAGVDTYVYARGDGNDIVDDGLVFENNNLVLHGITVSEMKVAFVGYDVVISFADFAAEAGDAGSIRFRADDYWHAHALGTITFDDGTVLNPSQWTGIGYDQANVFHPGDGDRTVRVNFTDGALHAFLLHGYTPDQVSVTGVDYLGQITLSMVNATAGTPEAIHLVNPSWEKGVDQIQFDNGAVWTRDDLRYKAYIDDGTHGSTVTLDTAIYTNQSAFVGGTGDTIYIVDAGLQPVSIADHGGTNALTLRGVSQAQVDFSIDVQTDELVLAIHDVPGRNDSVVKFAHGLDTKGVAAVHFDDGSMTAAEIQTWIDTHNLAA